MIFAMALAIFAFFVFQSVGPETTINGPRQRSKAPSMSLWFKWTRMGAVVLLG